MAIKSYQNNPILSNPETTNQLSQSFEPSRKFWLFGTDVVSIPRPFARTLPDRTFVHKPNTIKGNKPIAIGHEYSHLVFFPEKLNADDAPWAVPLIVRRIRSDEKATTVGAEQLDILMGDETLPWHNELCVSVEDSTYSAVTHLGPVMKQEHENLVVVARSRGNRVFYRPAPPVEGKRGRGPLAVLLSHRNVV